MPFNYDLKHSSVHKGNLVQLCGTDLVVYIYIHRIDTSSATTGAQSGSRRHWIHTHTNTHLMNLLLNQQLQTHTGQVAKSTLQNFTSFHVKGQELRVWKTVLKQCESCQNKSFFSFRYLTILSVLHKEPVNLTHIKHPLNILLTCSCVLLMCQP